MKRLIGMWLCLAPLLVGGCARHYVVERDVGRVNGAKSITSNSNTEWMIHREPEKR